MSDKNDIIHFAKMEKDIEHTKKELGEVKGKVESIDEKLHNLYEHIVGGAFDSKYASKNIERAFWWAAALLFTSLVTLIGFLIQIVLR